MYGHPEHRAAAMLVREAARAVAPEWRARVFAAENRFGSLPADLDPGPVTLRFPAEVPCSPHQTCWEVGADAVAAYSSQRLTDFRAVPAAERFTNLRELD
jgi:LmbE family N-acetylglucosaminyl deacetylase